MKIVDQSKYDDWKNKNMDDPYGAAIFNYAEAWANLMESKIAAGEALESIAQQASRDADSEGITGFMYGMAVSVLSQCWEHGEKLRKWHNKDYGKPDCEGVINPAVMIIEIPEK